MAPELFDRKEIRAYDAQCDLWSLGVILYICLCGYPPFSLKDGLKALVSKIRNGDFEFRSPHWDGVSKEAKDLVNALLEVDPRKRMTASDALNHKWMNLNVG